jgi:hypothetical protein
VATAAAREVGALCAPYGIYDGDRAHDRQSDQDDKEESGSHWEPPARGNQCGMGRLVAPRALAHPDHNAHPHRGSAHPNVSLLQLGADRPPWACVWRMLESAILERWPDRAGERESLLALLRREPSLSGCDSPCSPSSSRSALSRRMQREPSLNATRRRRREPASTPRITLPARPRCCRASRP